jgi:hypothetical protein
VAGGAFTDTGLCLTSYVALLAQPIRVLFLEQTAIARVHPEMSLRGEPASPGTWHTHSVLRSKQPASRNAFCRILSPSDSEEPMGESRGFPALGLLETPHLIRLTSAAVRVNTTTTPAMASPHLPRASPEGALGVTAQARLTDVCNPHFFYFQRRVPASRTTTDP